MKKILSIILSLMLLLCLSACSSNSETETGNQNTDKPAASQGTKQPDASTGNNQSGVSNGTNNSAASQGTKQPGTSTGNNQSGSEYWGTYKTNDGGFLAIYDDGTFEIADSEGDVYTFGTCSFEDGLTLTSEDGEIVFLVLDEYGNLYGGEEVGTLIRIDLNDLPSDIPNNTLNELDFTGYWKYGNGYIIEIMGDRWYLYDDSGKMLQSGPAEFEGTKAWLMNEDGSSGGGYLYFDDDGDLIESGEVLTRLAEFPYGNSENTLSSDVLEGKWYYADIGGVYNYPTLYFDGDDRYIWEWDDHYYAGTYTFDGEEIVLFDDEGGYTYALYQNDRIYIDGDAGRWYSKN